MDIPEREKVLLRRSFERLEPKVPEASVEFYETLFELGPHLRRLFREDDMSGQGMRFMTALGVIIGHLDDPESLRERLAHLGRSHANFGLTREDYRLMEEALFLTLREALAPDFDAATQTAWRRVFRQITEAMAPKD
ncbi:MAG: globin [Alphaproteobacteria bacterium]|nr:MAG: globin [Alphaproteobacteria bacterium]